MLKAEGFEYEANGAGEAVLLIHGSHIADAHAPLMREAALAERYRLIRYHRRGFAGSARMTGAFSIERQAQDALALLTHLGVERAHVVGHSYGGAIGLQLAIDAPSRVRSLVVLEPAIMGPDTSAAFFEAAAPIFAAYGAGDHAKAVDLFLTAVSAPDWRSVVEHTVPGGPEQAEKTPLPSSTSKFRRFRSGSSTPTGPLALRHRCCTSSGATAAPSSNPTSSTSGRCSPTPSTPWCPASTT